MQLHTANTNREETKLGQETYAQHNDPWGVVYKILYNKYKAEHTLTSLNINKRTIDNFHGVVHELLQGLLPDDTATDTDEHNNIRTATSTPNGQAQNDFFTEEDLKYTVWEMNRRKL